jgi:lysophospholipase L1-like esterase
LRIHPEGKGSVFPRRPEVLLVAASIAISLGAVETGMRIAGIRPLSAVVSGDSSSMELVDDARQYAFRPGFVGRFGGMDVRINSLGYRGPELRNEPSEFSVAVIGDSIAFGLYVSFEETFCRVLERALGYSNVRANVVNLGVPGYDTLQEVASLTLALDALKPQLVVVQFSLNDAEVASPSLDRLARRSLLGRWFVKTSRVAELVVKARYRRRFENFHRWANDDAVFLSTYANRIDSVDGDADLARLMQLVRNEFSSVEWPMAWYGNPARVGRIRHAFSDLARSLEKHGIPAIVLVVPLLDDVDGAYPFDSVHAVVAHEAVRAGFSVVDASSAFLARGMRALRADPQDDVHPNAEGHAILAAILLDPLIRHRSAR